jgi:hypothetical protein
MLIKMNMHYEVELKMIRCYVNFVVNYFTLIHNNI